MGVARIGSTGGMAGCVLVVDDEEAILRAFARLLRRAGYQVHTAVDAQAALAAVDQGGGAIDVILSDIHMPGMSGMALLAAVRSRDPDVPFILMTGVPHVETATLAIEHGVLRYLLKPVDHDKLLDAVADGVHRRRSSGPAKAGPGPLDLDRAMSKLWVAYQPIVSWAERRIFAFEALVRSDDAALQGGVMVETAERLGRIVELGRGVREAVVPTIAGSDALFFVNLHPAELLDEALYDASSALGPHARRVIFEITERRSLTDIPDLADRLEYLRSKGYRFALDDLGAGYAGLASVAQLAPDVMKLDMSLVRGVHESSTKQKLVGSMAQLARELAVPLVAEGVETCEERRTLLRLGCNLLQGYLFARPGRPLPEVPFEHLAADSVAAPPVGA
jgi:EAL domain-containing protein (putative c-di-GMP-specific phosphodiesterase class I)